MAETLELRFACDAMLGGLARWLRAAGYDASWSATVGDWELIRLALREGRTLLTCDTGIFRIGIVRDGEVLALLIPHGLSKQAQLAFVLHRLNLPLREPRCMACGGHLTEISREQLGGRVPPRTLAWLERFYQCSRCGQLFWQGTHWQHIAKQLETARTRKVLSAFGEATEM
jgi:uncharacterized protein with PIN domain